MAGCEGNLASSEQSSCWGLEVEGSNHVVLGRADSYKRLSRTSAGSGPLEGAGAGTARSRRTGSNGIGCTDDVAFLVENIRLQKQSMTMQPDTDNK